MNPRHVRRHRTVSLVATLAAASMIAAACGGDDESSSTTAAAPPADSVDTTADSDPTAPSAPVPETTEAEATTEPTAAPATTADESPAEVLTLKVAVGHTETPPLPNAILDLADTLGYYEAEGLDVELIHLDGTPLVVTALQAGEADIGNIALEELASLVAGDLLDLRGFHSSDANLPFLIAANNEIQSAADLSGRTFAIAQSGSLDDTLTRLVLSDLGVDAESLAYLEVGAPSVRAQALAEGRVDATTVSVSTWLGVADLATDASVLVDVDQFFDAAPIMSKINAAKTSTIEEKGEAIQRFVNAQVKLAQDLAADPTPWVEALAEVRPDLTADDLSSLAPFFADRWCVDGCLDRAAMETTLDFLYQSEDFEGLPVVTVDDLVDFSFVD